MALSPDEVADEVRRSILQELVWLDICRANPVFFSNFVTCVDSRSGDTFHFQMLSKEECDQHDLPFYGDDWKWQRDYIDWVNQNEQTITLKGRQLGVTWIWAFLCLHDIVFESGVDDLIYSIKEGDAIEVIGRIWDMWLSLPDFFKEEITVLKPARGARPTTEIVFEHSDGRISTITGMAATKSAGHGRSARRILFDEAARQEYARELWKAVLPAMADFGGVIGVVSTANGMSDGKGRGNFFHELWVGAGKADYPKLKTKFLRWSEHPGRDQDWYENLSMGQADKAEQYPDNPEEAFLLSGSPYFDVHALKWYAQHLEKPIGQYRFIPYENNPAKAVLEAMEGGPIELYRKPDPQHKYAISADLASGTGEDFSVAYVIDLMSGEIAAELYMKADYVDFSEQLHFLGVWFHNATIAPEKGGGYGDVVIGHLRDGNKGRKPYPKVYRHRSWDHPTRPAMVQLGFPMTDKTRPHVISSAREWVNKTLLPYMTAGLLRECRTFVYRETRPSPRAADGCNDDRVMALGIALTLYGEMGEHPHSRRKKNRKRRKPKATSALDPRAQRSR